MSSCASFFFLFLFSFLTSFRVSAQQDPNYVWHVCPNTTIYTRNSTYFTNLKTLLSSFSSRNASYSTGFQSATAGQAPDRVTGLFNCRGDVSPEVCRRCVVLAVNDTLTRCPKEREVALYYDECILRYSNRNILSTIITNGAVILVNTRNVTSKQLDRLSDVVLPTLNQAATEAVNSPKKFDARKTNFNAFQNLYGLVHCTPDLTRQDCSRCLQIIINQIPTDKLGARIIAPSCSSRYELYPFYNESAVRTPPPPRTGKRGNSSVLVAAIVVPIIVVVLLFIAGYCFLARKAKKSYDTASTFDGDDITTADSLQLDYRTIQTATDDFAVSNKIGQGGFGEVYKINNAKSSSRRSHGGGLIYPYHALPYGAASLPLPFCTWT